MTLTRRWTATSAAIAATALFALTGCGSEEAHGKVTGKEHDAALTEWRTEPKTKQVCTTSYRSGKSTRSCRTVSDGTRRVAHHKPECWELELDTGEEACVSESVWRATDIGDHV